MAEIINMPKLGFDMAEGTLVRWVKAEGDSVQQGEVLAEIETDKATVEVESAASGTILKHLVGEGTVLPIGEPIAVIGESGEQVDLEAIAASAEHETAAAEEPAAVEPVDELSQPAISAAPAGADGDLQLPDGVKASPVARRIAAEQQINLAMVQGTGPGGRIVKKDVEQAAQAGIGAGAGLTARGFASQTMPLKLEKVPISRLRAAIGRRMSASKQQLPHFYVTADLDAGPMMAMRRQANELMPDGEKLSVNDFIVKASALALRRFPNINASLNGDEIIRHGEINVGIAVAVEGGLLTVVVRDADSVSLPEISSQTRQMAARARDGKVHPADVEGSTFTVSNLGMFDVDHFIAIVNPPECAILATGSVREMPVVVDGQVKVGQRLKVTLSADHRITDGAEAARWLQAFRQVFESPLQLML